MRHGAAALIACLGCALAACDGPTDTASPADPRADGAYLREITAAARLDFVHAVGASRTYPIAEIIGAGCAVFDADGDGRLDLYFAQGGGTPRAAQPNRLFLRQPDGTYADATEGSGLGDRSFTVSVALGDVDADGDLDVYLGNWGPDVLYLNEGGGRFVQAGPECGIAGDHMSVSTAFLDFDGDGRLDLYVVHYVEHDPLKECGGADRGRDYCSPKAYRPVADTLYRNRGDGTFLDVSVRSGVAALASAGLGLQVDDFDGDGRPDVFVANDRVANHLWLNRGDGTFREAALEFGVALNGMGAAEASMGVALGDADGDGVLDLLLSHLTGETNTLYIRRGSAFVDASATAAVGSASLPYTGWGIALADLDHDGDLDAVTANGAVRRGRRLPGVTLPAPWDRYAEPNLLQLNDGAGVFAAAPGRGGTFTSAVEISRGLVPADLDGDGDLDLVVTQLGGPARLFENVAPAKGHWLQVVVRDPAQGAAAEGAHVVVRAGGRAFVRRVSTFGGYASATDPTVHVGLGAADAVESLTVTWADRGQERFPVPQVDRVVTCVRGEGER